MRYFITVEGAQQGPYSIYELKDMAIDANTFVRAEESNEWARAKDVDELRRFLGFTGEETLPPVVQAVPQQPAKLKKSHTGCIVFLLLFIVLAGAMVVTNPSKERHTEVITQRMGSIIEAAMSPGQSSNADNLGEALIRGGIDILKDIFGSKTTQSAIGSLLDYHNYFLFSTTSITLFEKSQTLSVGVFGHVFTVNEDDVERLTGRKVIQPSTSSPSIIEEEKATEQVEGPAEEVSPSNPQPSAERPDIVRDIEQEIISSVGKIAKRQVEQRTDSLSGNAWGKVIDGMTDIIKEHVK
ncbi:MAG: DUF4339 domain-containing protein [Prevotella sp.]|nr:DUF4339 domain-containing protein [Prevotella sp.]